MVDSRDGAAGQNEECIANITNPIGRALSLAVLDALDITVIDLSLSYGKAYIVVTM